MKILRDLTLLTLPVRHPQRLLVDLAVEQPRQAFDEIDALGLLVARDQRAGVFERIRGRGATLPLLHTLRAASIRFRSTRWRRLMAPR
jgi:hypothetical protein